MKVVLNKCYGGFSLSTKAVEALAAKKGLTLYWFTLDRTSREMVPVDDPEGAHFPLAYTHPDGPKGEKGTHFDSRPSDRSDTDLVAVVEELGSEVASGELAELHIIEIPDDVKWDIEEYDGIEWVSERHRRWS